MGFVLGINAFHFFSSACLIQDGKIIAAAEEERFRRIKHWAGFPSQAIAYCLCRAGATRQAASDGLHPPCVLKREANPVHAGGSAGAAADAAGAAHAADDAAPLRRRSQADS